MPHLLSRRTFTLPVLDLLQAARERLFINIPWRFRGLGCTFLRGVTFHISSKTISYEYSFKQELSSKAWSLTILVEDINLQLLWDSYFQLSNWRSLPMGAPIKVIDGLATYLFTNGSKSWLFDSKICCVWENQIGIADSPRCRTTHQV